MFWAAVESIGFGFIGSGVFFVTSLPVIFGKKYVEHIFQQKIAAINSTHQMQIDKLKSDLDRLKDRGIRANEKEFNATILVWKKLISAFVEINQCLVGFRQIPDLKSLSEEDLEAFLSREDLTDRAKASIKTSPNRNSEYSKQMHWREINSAQNSIYEMRICLMEESIFLNEEVRKRITQEIDLYHRARVEKWMNFSEQSKIQEPASLELLTSGMQNLQEIENLLRNRLSNSL